MCDPVSMLSKGMEDQMHELRAGDGRTPRIVIVGGGFAGAYCAQELERRLRPGEAEVVLLDRNNYFVFYPLLVEAGTGSLEPRASVLDRVIHVEGEVFVEVP